MEFRFDPSARRFLVRTLVPEGQAERAFAPDDMFQFGIEEEYFLSDAHTLLVPPETPDALFRRANFGVAGSIGREFLQAQIEVATEPHIRAGDARRELLRLRQNAAGAAAEHGLSILACGTHPTAYWKEAVQSPKDRYAQVMDALQMIGQRNMLCGMHVHVEFPDPTRRVDVMTRMLPYLPLFIALSASSPFWQGRATGLKGYRLGGLRRIAPHRTSRAVPQQRRIRCLCRRHGALGSDGGRQPSVVVGPAFPEISDAGAAGPGLLHAA